MHLILCLSFTVYLILYWLVYQTVLDWVSVRVFLSKWHTPFPIHADNQRFTVYTQVARKEEDGAIWPPWAWVNMFLTTIPHPTCHPWSCLQGYTATTQNSTISAVATVKTWKHIETLAVTTKTDKLYPFTLFVMQHIITSILLKFWVCIYCNEKQLTNIIFK